jgi:hypothetical protein
MMLLFIGVVLVYGNRYGIVAVYRYFTDFFFVYENNIYIYIYSTSLSYLGITFLAIFAMPVMVFMSP